MKATATRAIFTLAALGLSTGFAHAQLGLQQVATGLSQPLFVTAPAGDSRLFIVEKTGLIKVRENGSVLPTPFLDLSSLIDTAGERGLLGLTFDPNYATNRQFYVDYIDKTSLATKVRRYTAPSATSNVATFSSGQDIISIGQTVNQSNHKGGWIGFRPGDNANLYVATGDGGSSNDPNGNGQNLNVNLAKILRIDVSSGLPGYSIPASNPFVGVAGNDEIWAYGVRNPFRNSFDRLTGDFYIGDVGQDTREEIDFEAAPGIAGRNYGWRALEGSGDNPAVGDAAPANATAPIFSYNHAGSPTGSGSVTGGYVYRGSAISSLYGKYIFGDFVNGTFRTLTVSGGVVSGPVLDITGQIDPLGLIGTNSLSSFGEDAFGNLYVTDIGGQVYLIVPEPTSALSIAAFGMLALRRTRRSR